MSVYNSLTPVDSQLLSRIVDQVAIPADESAGDFLRVRWRIRYQMHSASTSCFDSESKLAKLGCEWCARVFYLGRVEGGDQSDVPKL